MSPLSLTRAEIRSLAAKAGPDSPLHALAGQSHPTAADEADDQMALLELLVGPSIKGEARRSGAGMTTKYPELFLIYAINPNPGGHPSARARGRAKAMGQLANMPDLHLPVARGPFIGLYLELKRQGKYGTKDQRRMGELLRFQGHCVVECQGGGEALSVVIGYLGLGKNRPSARAVCGPGVMPGLTLEEKIDRWRDSAYLLLKPVRS